MRRSESLVQLQLTGPDSFYADDSWREQIVGRITCKHCRNVLEGVRSVDAVVNNRRRKTDLDLISPDCGRIEVFSEHLIEVIGLRQVERVAGLGRVIDVRGFVHERHRTAVALRDSVVVRGCDSSTAGLCRKCGRLLFGAVGEQYVIRSQIPAEPFFISDGGVFCTNQFWKDHILPARLTRVEALDLPIREAPEDGLPTSISRIKSYLKLHRRFK